MAYACWTNLEIRKLVEMHMDRIPPLKELAAALPRHPYTSIKTRAHHLDLRHKDPPANIRWLKIAHLHFSKRGA